MNYTTCDVVVKIKKDLKIRIYREIKIKKRINVSQKSIKITIIPHIMWYKYYKRHIFQ